MSTIFSGNPKFKKKNTRKLRRTLKARISVMAKRIWLKFGMECVLPEGFSKENIVQFRSGIIELRMRENGIYLVPV